MGKKILAYFYSIVLHIVLAGLLIVTVGAAKPAPKAMHKIAIEATVVNQADIEQEIQRLDQLDRQRQREEQQRIERQRQEEQRLQELETQRKQEEAEAAQRQADLERQRQEQEAEQERLAKQIAEQKAEAERVAAEKAEAERLRKIEEEKALEAKRKREAEEKRQAELKRKREEEEKARRAAELKREQEAREADLLAALNDEQELLNARQSGEADQYALLLQSHIEQNWIRPPNVQSGLRCELRVKQIPGGEVVSVSIGECNADPTTLATIERAVYRSSPLPAPPKSILFDRSLRITFAPDD